VEPFPRSQRHQETGGGQRPPGRAGAGRALWGPSGVGWEASHGEGDGLRQGWRR